MSEKEKQLNLRPLIAYEAMQGEVTVKQIPGFQKPDEKDNYRRYNKKGISNALLG